MMEILNRNQRKSAVWRVAALLGILVAMLFTILTSMHLSYTNQGDGELQILRESISDMKDQYVGEINNLKLDTTRLSLEISNLKSDNASQKKITELNEEIEIISKRLERKQERLEECFDEKTELESKLRHYTP